MKPDATLSTFAFIARATAGSSRPQAISGRELLYAYPFARQMDTQDRHVNHLVIIVNKPEKQSRACFSGLLRVLYYKLLYRKSFGWFESRLCCNSS
jgi:hypothetical protein